MKSYHTNALFLVIIVNALYEILSTRTYNLDVREIHKISYYYYDDKELESRK